jgi:demethylmenaquinone methyltransferase / 2-methoxy-6-polyprenyl-1,4-benzoquinol methylase
MKTSVSNSFLQRSFSEESTKYSYSKVAWFYNYWGRMTETKAHQKVLELAKIKDGESILEVGMGTGTFFLKIVEQNPQGHNAGIDLSPAMLSRAEKLLKKRSPDSHFNLSIGSAYELPFNDQTFDLVVNNFMLDLLPEADFGKVLKEFRRVLRPGGRVVLSTMAFGDRWYHGFWRWLAKALPSLLTGCRPVSLHRYLEEVGFKDIFTARISQNTFPSEVSLAQLN